MENRIHLTGYNIITQISVTGDQEKMQPFAKII